MHLLCDILILIIIQVLIVNIQQRHIYPHPVKRNLIQPDRQTDRHTHARARDYIDES